MTKLVTVADTGHVRTITLLSKNLPPRLFPVPWTSRSRR